MSFGYSELSHKQIETLWGRYEDPDVRRACTMAARSLRYRAQTRRLQAALTACADELRKFASPDPAAAPTEADRALRDADTVLAAAKPDAELSNEECVDQDAQNAMSRLREIDLDMHNAIQEELEHKERAARNLKRRLRFFEYEFDWDRKEILEKSLKRRAQLHQCLVEAGVDVPDHPADDENE